ncbi:MAG: GNAT family N-acetyltransferase [Planctomycetota bacterium]|nr:GNAT family N-acetyltransferase [Planctomycetota bacterium]
MSIRPATSADVAAVLPMVRALCDLHQAHDPERFKVLPDVLDRYARWLPERAADPRSVFLVAESAGTHSPGNLIAFTVGTIEPEVPIFWIPECGWIHDLWVEPAHRGRGLARALAREMVARFGALGVKQVRLHTGAFNESARRVFASAGFRPCVVEMLAPTSPNSPAPTSPASPKVPASPRP